MSEKQGFAGTLKRQTLQAVYEYQMGKLVDLVYEGYDRDNDKFSILLHFLVDTYGEAFYFDFAQRVEERSGQDGSRMGES